MKSDKISEADKETIKNYIYTYGVRATDFVGLDEWLANWSHSNQKLYKLLGNKLIVEIPFEYEKSENQLMSELTRLVNTASFLKSYSNFVYEYIKQHYDNDIYTTFCSLSSVVNFYENKTKYSIKLPKVGNKKCFKFQQALKL